MDGNIFLVGERVITLALILLAGVYARKINILDDATTKKFSAFLVNITQPLMIIASFQMEFDIDRLREGAWIFVVSAAVHLIVAAIAWLLFKPVRNFEARKIYQMGTVFANIGFLGFPVLSVIFGYELGIFYGVFYTMFFNFFVWTYGVYLISKKSDEKNMESMESKVKLPLRKIFLNANMISSVAGILMFVLRIRIPTVLLDSVQLVGDMTFPLAMIIIGSLICTIKFKEVFADKRIYYFLFVKLLLLPVVMLLIGAMLNIPSLFVYIGALMLAMPSGALVAILAETYESDAKAAAANVGISTLFSIITIPAVLWIIELVLG